MTKPRELLLAKLKAKLLLNDSALQKKIQRKANHLGISTESALALIAKEANISTIRYEGSLPVEKQEQIRSSLVIKSPIGGLGLARKNKAEIPLKILNLKVGQISEPLLPSSILNEAVEVSKTAYPILYVFENSVRNFIRLALERSFGRDWWEQQMDTVKLDEIKNQVARRMVEEERRAWHGQRGAHPIFYTDFDHLIDLLKAKRAIFNSFFNDFPGKTQWLISRLEEVKPSRNVIDHHNPLTKKDNTRLQVYFSDWAEALTRIKEKL